MGFGDRFEPTPKRRISRPRVLLGGKSYEPVDLVAAILVRVVALAAGAASQTVLPFTGLEEPLGVAVGGDGTVYVTSPEDGTVMKSATG